MTSVNRFGLSLAAFVMLAGASNSLAQLPIHSIQLFNTSALPVTDFTRDDAGLAIDGNPNTFSYLTPPLFGRGPRVAGLDFGSLTNVNRLQINRAADADGFQDPNDAMDLQILYTTDLGPIESRHYQPVSGLTNGYLGSELSTATSVNASDATVKADIAQGIYSLSFNNVSATGLGFRFAANRDNPAVPLVFSNLATAEFTPMSDTTPRTVSAINVFRPEVPAGSINFNRTEQPWLSDPETLAIDGDLNTWTYLTGWYTADPASAALDLGSSTLVNRIRVAKLSNDVTGLGGPDPMNLQVLYTTDTGPLNERTYHPVTGLTNGFNGTELIVADSIDSSTASVLGEIHQFSTDDWYSLSFDAVNATAIALGVAKPVGASNPYDNYPTQEIELYGPPPVPGDYNGNGKVDAGDYVLWRKGGPLQNEVNTPGTVDASDYAAWRARFSNTAGSGSGSLDGGAVPEPSTSLLALLAIVTTAAIGRGRRSSPGSPDCNL